MSAIPQLQDTASEDDSPKLYSPGGTQINLDLPSMLSRSFGSQISLNDGDSPLGSMDGAILKKCNYDSAIGSTYFAEYTFTTACAEIMADFL